MIALTFLYLWSSPDFISSIFFIIIQIISMNHLPRLIYTIIHINAVIDSQDSIPIYNVCECSFSYIFLHFLASNPLLPSFLIIFPVLSVHTRLIDQVNSFSMLVYHYTIKASKNVDKDLFAQSVRVLLHF